MRPVSERVRDRLGVSWGPLGGFLGASWELFGASWAPLWDLWGPRGGLLGPKARIVRSDPRPGHFLQPSWGSLGPSWGSWGALGQSWGRLGGLCGCLGAIMGAFWAILRRRESQKGRIQKTFKNHRKTNKFCLLERSRGPYRSPLGESWTPVRPPWDPLRRLEAICGSLVALLDHLGDLLRQSWRRLGLSGGLLEASGRGY